MELVEHEFVFFKFSKKQYPLSNSTLRKWNCRDRIKIWCYIDRTKRRAYIAASVRISRGFYYEYFVVRFIALLSELHGELQ